MHKSGKHSLYEPHLVLCLIGFALFYLWPLWLLLAVCGIERWANGG